MFELPKLPYSYDALEPFIDAKTMEIHHSKHHKTYVDKLNAAVEKHPDLQKKKVEELLKDLNKVPEDVRTAVKNHGGGVWNHSFFWQILKKGTKPQKEILKAIEKKYGNFDEFKKQFSDKATTLFGSGWTWLVLNGKDLEIVQTSNQDSVISQGKKPLIALDLWEHSYYLKYQNRRAEYIEAFFNVINWDKVNELYKK